MSEIPKENDIFAGSGREDPGNLQPSLQPDAPNPVSPSVSAPLAASFDTTLLRWCSQCEKPVLPVGDGNHCPDCGGWTSSNEGHSKKQNPARKREYLTKFSADYDPQTEAERLKIRTLADVAARLDARNTTIEQARLIEMMGKLTADLDAIKRSRLAQSAGAARRPSRDRTSRDRSGRSSGLGSPKPGRPNNPGSCSSGRTAPVDP